MTDRLRNEIVQVYGNRIRVRACGCLVIQGKLLLLKHEGIGEAGYFWNVPGGGSEPGEPLRETVEREFLEETGMRVKAEEFLCLYEFISPPLHAIELYFRVTYKEGTLTLGNDPENVHLLAETGWFDKNELALLPIKAKPEFLIPYLDFD